LFYLGYLLLMVSPFLNLLFILVKQKMKNENVKRWLIIVIVLILAFLIAVVRHSWRANYNLDIPKRVMGRYVIYFSPILLITSFLTFKLFDKKNYKSFWQFLLLSFLLPIFLIAFSYLLVLSGKIFQIENDFVHPLISIDGYYIRILGTIYFIFIVLLFIFTNLALWSNYKKILELTATILILFYVIGEPKYLSYYIDYQYYQEIGTKISNLIKSCNKISLGINSYKIYLPKNILKDDKQDIEWSIYIRNLSSDYSISSYSPIDVNNVIESQEGIIVYPINNNIRDFPETGFYENIRNEYIIELLNGQIFCLPRN